MAYTDALQKGFLGQLSAAGAGNTPGPGGQDLGLLSTYFRTLLGGNRQKLMQAAAPAANAARDAADAAKNEQARRGTARTGGTVAASQQTEDELRKQIDTLIGQQQSQAAAGLKGVSDTELQTMMNALGMGSSIAQSDINSRRAASAQMWSALIGGAASLGTGLATGGLSSFMKGAGGGGGGSAGVATPSFSPIPIGGTSPIAPLPPAQDPTYADTMNMFNVNTYGAGY